MKKKYEIWIEGYAATDEHVKAYRLVSAFDANKTWEAETFQEACEKVLETEGWDMKYYNKEQNTYWACRFFDNEKDARKSFG